MNQFLAQHFRVAEGLPAWFQQRRQDAYQLAEQLPDPSLLDENWRFGAIKQTKLDGYGLAERTQPQTQEADAELVIRYVNGYPQSLPPELPKGLYIADLASFIATQGDQAQTLLTPTPQCLGSEKLLQVHRALQEHGIIILAQDDCMVHIKIEHECSGDQALSMPSTYVLAQNHARITITESISSQDMSQHLCVHVLQITAKSGARVDYALKQTLNHQSKCVQLQDLQAYASATIHHVTAQEGSAWIRQETVASLMEIEANIKLFSANSLTNTAQLDQRTRQWHVCQGTYSNLLYKNVLNHQAKTIFAGMILVDTGAHLTSAYQSNHNLMMSESAEANSMPGLEILADGVQCSHGSATSSVSQEEIFYLLSRGIDEMTAKSMIAHGFLRQTLSEIDNDVLLRYLFSEE